MVRVAVASTAPRAARASCSRTGAAYSGRASMRATSTSAITMMRTSATAKYGSRGVPVATPVATVAAP